MTGLPASRICPHDALLMRRSRGGSGTPNCRMPRAPKRFMTPIRSAIRLERVASRLSSETILEPPSAANGDLGHR